MLHRRTLLALPLLAAPATAQHAFIPTPEALSLLRAGGLNLYIRHAITDRTQMDTGRRGDRAGQRNLSEAGRQQARALGQAFRALDIPVAEVLTSEVFRAADTADLAFGQARVERDLIADDYTPGSASEDARAVSRRLAQPATGGNRVMVGHIVPLGMILGRGLAQAEFPEGSMGLFRPRGADWQFLGFVTAEQLIAAAGSR
ncbi:histidine phosphatase family protein [Roseococcus suduntuyensis]|uniref:Phosphohistidine phosphatase SixA n=1 Tax=Roseococcus suduntuyensis TaxID=455361 RepID=A0A840A9C7_9PROT|nr:histidine phosphatase family protein [Roseococcus suduntuyensis]MBB3897472.1 phosphohistidine phosphatase SixA [Roseococcus suduntuyensis]